MAGVGESELSVVHGVRQLRLVLEEEREIRRQDAVLYYLEHVPVLLPVELLEDVVPLLEEDILRLPGRDTGRRSDLYLLQYGDRLIEVMVLERAGGVHVRERRCRLDHELVVLAPVVEVVAESADEQSQALGRIIENAVSKRETFELSTGLPTSDPSRSDRVSRNWE